MHALDLGLLLGRQRETVDEPVFEARAWYRRADAFLDVLPGAGDGFLRTIELQLDAPRREAFRLGEAVELLVRRASRLRDERAQLRLARLRKTERAAETRHADEAEILEMVDVRDERHDVAPFRHEHGAATIGFGLWHQPEAHLRDDAEVGLAEQSRDVRSEPYL